MAWTRLPRIYGMVQDFRRRCGQECLHSFTTQDGLIFHVPPVRRDVEPPKPHQKRSDKAQRALRKRQLKRVAPWEEHLNLRAGGSVNGDGGATTPVAEAPTGAASAQAAQAATKRARFPEERLMWDYFKRNKEAHLLPYRLNSVEQPFVKRFALRQWALMQQESFDKEQAYKQVWKEMGPQHTSILKETKLYQPSSHSYSAINLLQEQEEQQLQKGLEELHHPGA